MINFRNSKFFSIEGQDGSGKDSVAEGLINEFEKMGYIVKVHSPYYNFNIGCFVKSAITSDQMSPDLQMASVTMTRFIDMVRIEKALIEDPRVTEDFSNVVIIANRWVDSTYAYQCYGKGANSSDLVLWSEELGLPVPTATVYIECPIVELKRRLENHGKVLDGHETQSFEFFEKIGMGFVESLREVYQGARSIAVIQSGETKEETLDDVMDFLSIWTQDFN